MASWKTAFLHKPAVFHFTSMIGSGRVNLGCEALPPSLPLLEKFLLGEARESELALAISIGIH